MPVEQSELLEYGTVDSIQLANPNRKIFSDVVQCLGGVEW